MSGDHPPNPFPPLPPPPGGIPPHHSIANPPPIDQPCLPEYIPVGPPPPTWHAPPSQSGLPFPPQGSWGPYLGPGPPVTPYYDYNTRPPRGRHPYYRGGGGRGRHRGGRGRGNRGGRGGYQYDRRNQGQYAAKRKPDWEENTSYPSKRPPSHPSSAGQQSTRGGDSAGEGKIFTKMLEDPWATMLSEEDQREHYNRLAKRFPSAPSYDELRKTTNSSKTEEQIEERLDNTKGQQIEDNSITILPVSQIEHKPPSCEQVEESTDKKEGDSIATQEEFKLPPSCEQVMIKEEDNDVAVVEGDKLLSCEQVEKEGSIGDTSSTQEEHDRPSCDEVTSNE